MTYIVQTRPITTLNRAGKPAAEKHDVLIQGLPAVPGAASGVVRVLGDVSEGARLQDGEVLVAKMTNPDWLPTMRRASALVTDTGGMTCHAAIVARELKVPCIVGARTATRDLNDGMVVTVDGTHGRVLAGRATVGGAKTAPAAAPVAAAASPRSPVPRFTSTSCLPTPPRTSPPPMSTASACCARRPCSPTR